jgi:hypothetical protein
LRPTRGGRGQNHIFNTLKSIGKSEIPEGVTPLRDRLAEG